MKTAGAHNYYVYITTNRNRTVLYTGVTNDLERRIYEHSNNMSHWTGKYKASHLLYHERFKNIEQAIAREKQIKGWTRVKKLELIAEANPEFRSLNEDIASQ